MKYKQLLDGRYVKTTVNPEDEPQHLSIYYARDNHTFKELPLDVEKSVSILRQEFAAGNSYGMLCAYPQGIIDVVHAGRKSEIEDFITRAIPWLEKCIELNTPPVIQEEENPCFQYIREEIQRQMKPFYDMYNQHPNA